MELTDLDGTRWVYDQHKDTYQPISPEGDASVPMPRIVFQLAYPDLFELFQGGKAVGPEATVCRCDHPYIGAHLVGTPNICETCRGLIDDVAQKRLDELYALGRAELERWARENPI